MSTEINMFKGALDSNISFSGDDINVKEDKGSIKLEPFRAEGRVFILREEGPFAIMTTNDKLTINYGGDYVLDVESSEDRGHIIRILNDKKDVLDVIEANRYEDGIEHDFGRGKISLEDGGRKLALYVRDEDLELEISLQVEGFDEKRKLKYVEASRWKTFSLEMKSRSEMNLEEINKVEQELLASNRAGMRSANMGIARSAVAGAITRSFDVFREHGLQVLRDGAPVVEL